MPSDKPTPPEPSRDLELAARANHPTEDAFGYEPPPTMSSYPDEPGENLWKRYLSVLGRHKLLLASIVLLGALAGLAGAFLVKPEYLAEARIWVEWEDRESRSDPGPFAAPELLRSYDWVDLLKSYAVLEHVVREERLYLRPHSPADTTVLAGLTVHDGYVPGKYELRVAEAGNAFELLRGDTTVVDSGKPGEPVGAQAGIDWTPRAADLQPGGSVEFVLLHPRDAARDLEGALDIQMLEQGNFIKLSMRGPNQERIASTVNAIADRFAAISIQLKESGINDVRTELAEQLADAELSMTRAESQLRDFRVSNSSLPMDGDASSGRGNPIQTDYFNMQYERDRIHRDRIALERLLDRNEDAGRISALLQTVPAAASSPVLTGLQTELATARQNLRTLSQEYTDDHPDVQAARQDIQHLETVSIPTSARQLAQALADREEQLDDAIQSRSGQLAAIPAAASEDARLKRTAQLSAEMYATLKQRYEEARLAAESTVSDVRVLDRASVAQRPVSDNRMPLVLFSVIASLGLGIAGVLVYDRFDPHIRYPDEVSRGMGLSILGTIPHLKLGRGGKDGPGLEVAAEAMEAFRGLRLNLSYAYGAAGPLVAAITSPGPGEGKSFVAMNLALSFARVGYRTLLIDGDVRRGRLHRSLQFPRRPGLTDYLLGDTGVEQMVRHTSHDGLDIMPCGIRKQDAPELLATNRLSELMTKLRGEYQVILVDTPPLGAGVDPLIFGVATGALLMVLRAGTSVRGLTENRMHHMSRLPVRVLGAVMNDVPPSASYPYYYSYLSDYTPNEEGSSTEAAPALIGT